MTSITSTTSTLDLSAVVPADMTDHYRATLLDIEDALQGCPLHSLHLVPALVDDTFPVTVAFVQDNMTGEMLPAAILVTPAIMERVTVTSDGIIAVPNPDYQGPDAMAPVPASDGTVPVSWV